MLRGGGGRKIKTPVLLRFFLTLGVSLYYLKLFGNIIPLADYFFILFDYFFVEEEKFLKDLSEAYSNDEESLYKRDAIFTEVSFTLNKCSIVLKSSKGTDGG